MASKAPFALLASCRLMLFLGHHRLPRLHQAKVPPLLWRPQWRRLLYLQCPQSQSKLHNQRWVRRQTRPKIPSCLRVLNLLPRLTPPRIRFCLHALRLRRPTRPSRQHWRINFCPPVLLIPTTIITLVHRLPMTVPPSPVLLLQRRRFHSNPRCLGLRGPLPKVLGRHTLLPSKLWLRHVMVLAIQLHPRILGQHTLPQERL